MIESNDPLYTEFTGIVARARTKPNPENIASLIEVTGLIPLQEYSKFEEGISAYSYLEYSTERRIIPWVDCLHANGHRREPALAKLQEIPNTFWAMVLIRRLNDWVPQVREAAHKTLLRLSSRTEASFFAEALWYLAPNYLRWGRIQPVGMSFIQDLTGRYDIITEVISMFIRERSGRLPSKYGALFRNSAIGPYLPVLANKACHPGIRALAYRSLLEGRFKWVTGRKPEWIDKTLGQQHFVATYDEVKLDTNLFEIESLIQKAATDKSVMVRRVAGDALIARTSVPTIITDTVADLLSTDSYPSVSERANFYLQNRTTV